MKTLQTTYHTKNRIEFIIDDKPKMGWIGNFNSEKYNRMILVIDRKVKRIYGTKIRLQLKRHKKEIITFEVNANEASKSLSFYPKLVSFLEKNNCNLADLVICVGGGTVIDLVGFTCSTYMRGLPFAVIATTLIGMVDASTAGKTCLNTEYSKNLLGTFYYPLFVYCNIYFLDTNLPHFHRQGLSEVFKYGLLGSKKLITTMGWYIKSRKKSDLTSMIEETIRVRITIRKVHPQASNLGHTFGHAIEKLSNYRILHGDAISAGSVIALELGKMMGLTKSSSVENIISMMKKLGLNIYVEKNLDVDDLLKIMMRDKKSTGKYLNLVLLRDIGVPYRSKNSFFYKLEPRKARNFFKNFIEEYPYGRKNCASLLKSETLTYQ